MLKNKRNNKSFSYSELILTDNESQTAFASVLWEEMQFMSLVDT